MVITAETMSTFLKVVEGLLHKGIKFKADAETLTITLTGGY